MTDSQAHMSTACIYIPDDVIRPKAGDSYLLGGMAYTFDERRYDFFVRTRNECERILLKFSSKHKNHRKQT